MEIGDKLSGRYLLTDFIHQYMWMTMRRMKSGIRR